MLQLCLDLETLDPEQNYFLVRQDSSPPRPPPITNQLFHSRTGSIISISTNIGKREENLDKVSYCLDDDFDLIAVLDGHGHPAVTNYLQNYLLESIRGHPLLLEDFETAVSETFQDIEDQLFKKIGSSSFNSGSTAIIVLVTKHQIWIANLGDSRVVSINRNDQMCQLNTEHNLLNEVERNEIVNRGGFVLKKGKEYRLGGEINLTRAFGDFKHKPIISAAPEMKRIIKDDLKCLLIGSDGFWGEIEDRKILEITKKGSDNLAETLMKSLARKPTDNATIVSYQFR